MDIPGDTEANASLLVEMIAMREHSRARAMQACHDLATRISVSRDLILESRELLAHIQRLRG